MKGLLEFIQPSYQLKAKGDLVPHAHYTWSSYNSRFETTTNSCTCLNCRSPAPKPKDEYHNKRGGVALLQSFLSKITFPPAWYLNVHVSAVPFSVPVMINKIIYKLPHIVFIKLKKNMHTEIWITRIIAALYKALGLLLLLLMANQLSPFSWNCSTIFSQLTISIIQSNVSIYTANKKHYPKLIDLPRLKQCVLYIHKSGSKFKWKLKMSCYEASLLYHFLFNWQNILVNILNLKK